jgi:hypothetical protein
VKTLKHIATAFGNAVASPGLIVWLLLISLLVALPNAMIIRDAVKDSVGASLAHERLRDGFDMEWHSDYHFKNDGIASLLTPTSVRPAAFLDNLEAWFSGSLFTAQPALVALGIFYALLWSMMSGGILYRFAHHDTTFSLRTLFSRGADYFPRFLRLMAITGVLYYGVYRISRWLFATIVDWTRDVTVEKTVLALNIVAALVVLALLTLVKLISDYAKVATVLEDRSSMLLAALQGLSFVVHHPLRTFGAYATIASAGLLALWGYSLVAPGQGQASVAGVLAAFLIAQFFLAFRIAQRLTVYGTAVEIYRDSSTD